MGRAEKEGVPFARESGGCLLRPAGDAIYYHLMSLNKWPLIMTIRTNYCTMRFSQDSSLFSHLYSTGLLIVAGTFNYPGGSFYIQMRFVRTKVHKCPQTA
jgi:hypothetical protein